MKRKIISAVVASVSLLIPLAVGAQSWTGPTQTPTGGNTAAPINVGTTAQTKNGSLGVNAFTAWLNSYFAGSVGIGILTPQSPLHVKASTGYGSIRISPAADNGEASMGFFSDSAGVTSGTAWVVGQGAWGNTGKFIIGNQANGGAIVTAQQNGNVGIGTVSPGAKLEVAGQVKITGGTPGAGKVLTSDAAGLATWATPAAGNPGTITGGGSTNYVPKWTSGTALGNSVMYDDGTNVGIGTVSPGAKLDVSDSAIIGNSAWSRIYMRDDESTGGAKSIHANSNVLGILNGSGSWMAYWDSSGNMQNAGNISFSNPNPYISASSYFVAPGGAYFNSGTVYTEAAIQARGGIHDDAHANLTISGGTSGNTSFSGTVTAPNLTVSGNAQLVAGNVGNNLKIMAGVGGATGITGYDSGNTWRWQLYGDGSNYGFLNGNWAGWDMMKTINGALVLNGSQTVFTSATPAASYPTFNQNTTGTASNVTALSGTWDGISYFRSNKGSGSYVGGQSSYGLEAFSSDGGAAGMSFHRGGYYAVNMGLDPDNVFRIGGWSAGANRLQLDMSGNLTLAGSVTGTAFYYSSDKTLKKNIIPLSDSLSKVLKLQGVSFDWKKDGTKSVGLIAQDVEKVYPELVKTDTKTGLKSVEYGNLVAPLIEAIKEQQKQIDALKAEVEALKK